MSSSKPSKQVAVAIVGAGHRALIYADYARQRPDRMKVVAVADPNPARRREVAELFNIPPQHQYLSHKELAEQPQLADAIINGTMDQHHVETCTPLLEKGYDILLEKPISNKIEDIYSLLDAVKECKRTLMICHVLRYSPFYQTIKRLICDDAIGRILSLHTAEHVSDHHMATAFVRGRWNKKSDSSPMILAKCCHDMDIIAWMMDGHSATRVASFGGRHYFTPENAPAGAADRCLNGCQVESSCRYSAQRIYIDAKLWPFYAWGDAGLINSSTQQKIESLKTNNPYGRCVWRCDNDVVDHQSVIIEYANGVAASHDMFCATTRPARRIHIIGTEGELEGDFEDGIITLRIPELRTDPQRAEHQYRTQIFDTKITGDSGTSGHGGGDHGLIEDFVSVVSGHPGSVAVTNLENSIESHTICFAAEQSRVQGCVVDRNYVISC